ncbi:MAG: hypothetical protein ACLPTB_16925 [Acidimicrobiales bacterium]|jgi:hypothetical protein
MQRICCRERRRVHFAAALAETATEVLEGRSATILHIHRAITCGCSLEEAYATSVTSQ